MKPLLAALIVIVALRFALPTAAQVPDHLKCYKVKDPAAKKVYTADLGGLVPDPGCAIKVPAAMACVPATKTNVQPGPPGGGGNGTPNAFACYKIKCPRATLPPLALNDQFGSRTGTPIAPKFVCAPLASTTTTTATTSTMATSSTTSTTLPPCNCPTGCGCAYKCSTGEQVCVGGGFLGGCTDTSCGPGYVCVGPSPMGCGFIGVGCSPTCP